MFQTPPNAHLVNICVTNLSLCVGMLLSIASLLVHSPGVERVLGNLQLFVCVTCFLQYWSIFADIGFYRYKTIKRPSMQLRRRRRMIVRSIVVGWVGAILLGVAVTVLFADSHTMVSWNPFRRKVEPIGVNWRTALSVRQTVALYAIALTITGCMAVLAKSYYCIFKTLYRARRLLRTRVAPWTRTGSVSSDCGEWPRPNRRAYRPDEPTTDRSVFTMSGSGATTAADNFIVHFQKPNHNLSLDEIFALETPLKAHVQIIRSTHRHLQPTLSNTSLSAQRHCLEFSDISPGAELVRFQRIKNNCAMRTQSLRSARGSLGGATRNSLIMIAIFLLCSVPLCVSVIPGVLVTSSTGAVTTTLLCCRLTFYVNAPLYPIWYLMFSKRVRKCLHKLYETILVRMNIRQ